MFGFCGTLILAAFMNERINFTYVASTFSFTSRAHHRSFINRIDITVYTTAAVLINNRQNSLLENVSRRSSPEILPQPLGMNINVL